MCSPLPKDYKDFGFLSNLFHAKLSNYSCTVREIAVNLPTLIVNKQLDSVVESLPLPSKEILENLTKEDHQVLYSSLCMIQSAWINPSVVFTSGYVEQVRTKVPRQIAVPLDFVSSRLGIRPLLTHAAVDLYNWKLKDESQPFSLDNLTTIASITGDPSESWFYLVMVAIEMEGKEIISEAINIANATKVEEVKVSLEIIIKKIPILTKILNRMKSNCDRNFFYFTLRKYLDGWTDEKKFPNGMHLEGVGEGIRHAGGSAAQSSLIPVLDILFGVKKFDFLIENRNYMPKDHRDLLSWLESKEIGRWRADLETLFCLGAEELAKFRMRHIGLVHYYIVSFSKESKGTGGSSPAVLLKEIHEETKKVAQ